MGNLYRLIPEFHDCFKQCREILLMDYEVAGGFVVKDKKLLMIQEESGCWNVPSEVSESGELSSDTALRAVEKVTGTDCEVHKYKSRMKTTYTEEETEYAWQPYAVNMDEEDQTENGEWVPVKEIKERELATPLEETADEVIDRI